LLYIYYKLNYLISQIFLVSLNLAEATGLTQMHFKGELYNV